MNIVAESKKLILFYSIVFLICTNKNTIILCDNQQGYNEVSNWKYHFPSGSGMGIYTALALPVQDSGNIDLFFAVFFEAFYLLPYNETSLEYPPFVENRRKFYRQSLYDSITEKLDSKGYPGENCLLKAICEIASYPTIHVNGIIGDLVHLLFTPSSTINSNKSYFNNYIEAERIGSENQNCYNYDKNCSINLFDLYSFVN